MPISWSQAWRRSPPQCAVPCRRPPFFQPITVRCGDGPFGALSVSHAVTIEGAVPLVPTTGRTQGRLVGVGSEGRDNVP
jgi:hypothetical protein